MQFINCQKLQEILLSSWTKFIDYEMLKSIITNNIELYAANWITIVPHKKYNVKNILLKQIKILNSNEMQFSFEFAMPYQEKIAYGNVEISCYFKQKPTIVSFSGVFLLHDA